MSLLRRAWPPAIFVFLALLALAGCGDAGTAAPPASPTTGGSGAAARPSPTTAGLAAAVPSPAPTPQPAAAAAPTIVDVTALDNIFEPPYLEVRAGTTVRWLNRGQDDHDVVADDGSFVSPVFKPGQTYEFTFTGAGTFPYLCDLHEGMTGTVVVR